MNKKDIKKIRQELIQKEKCRKKRVLFATGSPERIEQKKIIKEIIALRDHLGYHFPSDKKSLLKHDIKLLCIHRDKLRLRKKNNRYYT